MKFDCIIMNPPYQRGLHLKILAKAITQLKDDNSACVNLSPINWLQDPIVCAKNTSNYKKFNKSISQHINSLDIIQATTAQRLFPGIIIGTDIGLYECKLKSNTNYDYNKISTPDILSKCLKYIITNNPKLDKNKQNGWRVRMPLVTGGKSGGRGAERFEIQMLANFGKLLHFYNGKTPDQTKWWHECYQKNQFSKITSYITSSIKFNTETEAINFINQFETKFVKYITNLLICGTSVSPEKIIWMDDYTEPWTDERFYKFFNITEEEQKIIEETLVKYRQ